MLRAFDDAYYPNILMRPSEMKAILELPEAEKNSIFPIIRICPWLGSNSFQNSIDKIQEVYGDRPFICDIDESHPSRADRDAIVYFRSLFNGDQKARNWVSHIQGNASYIPTLHHQSRNQEEIYFQLDAFLELERGMAIRLTPQDVPNILAIREVIDSYVLAAGVDSICTVIDLGLVKDVNLSTQIALNLVEGIRQIPNLRVVISSASFPSSFSQYEGLVEVQIESRQLFTEIRRRFNDLELSYSDWASTKPRSGGGGVPIPRIDVPRNGDWVVARNKNESWNYQRAAEAIVGSGYWLNPPNVWGTHMINQTAEGGSLVIDSPAKATATRINLHLFIQNHFGSDAGGISTDEPWVDI